MHELLIFLKKIEGASLNLDFKNLNMTDVKVRRSFSKIKDVSSRISYNPWGTVTGRLATNKNSFPILTLDKTYRSIVKPKNDWFMEFDYNAAELRTLLALANKQQPTQDMHEWNVENLYSGNLSRF